jgi:carbon monoxide dehydrogenase subunit G
MHYEGSFEVVSPRDVVYSFVSDPTRVASILPDVQDVKIIDANSFSLKAKLGFSLVKGLMDVKCTFTEKNPSSSLRLNARASGLSSVVDLESSFTLEDTQGGGTRVKWAADAKITGLIVRVGSRLIDSATESYVTRMIDALKQKLRQ